MSENNENQFDENIIRLIRGKNIHLLVEMSKVRTAQPNIFLLLSLQTNPQVLESLKKPQAIHQAVEWCPVEQVKNWQNR